jgi:hypothetical protein
MILVRQLTCRLVGVPDVYKPKDSTASHFSAIFEVDPRLGASKTLSCVINYPP